MLLREDPFGRPRDDQELVARRVAQGLALGVLALVGLARVALRAHWPSDVAGGLALVVGLYAHEAAILRRVDWRPLGAPEAMAPDRA